jgi:hypothetical protein
LIEFAPPRQLNRWALAMNKQQALTVIDEMESLVNEFGAPNEEGLRIINRHIRALNWGHDFEGTLGEFESWAKIGLSARKWKRWRDIDQVKVFALGALSNARDLIDDWPASVRFAAR